MFGYEGFISGLCFNLMKFILVSVFWDKIVCLWDMFDSWRIKEMLVLIFDVLVVIFCFDGVELVVVMLNL